ncbi:MAG: hypothetical protein IM638_05645 [Bacteroidetes bacterium]|nr:hypothetical protein [Bacteroidota bacterium]
MVKVYYSGSKQLKYTGQNKNYLREGVWMYYAPNGSLTRTEEWHLNKLHGARKIYLNNTLLTHENYRDSVLHGMQLYYTITGTLKRKYWFTNGNADSCHVYPEGFRNPGERIVYEGKLIKFVKRYYNNGNLNQTEYYENGLKDGIWTTYSSSHPGEITETITYKNGVKEGMSVEITSTQVWKETNYSNNLRNGLEKNYIDGKLAYEQFYVNDKLNGYLKVYRDNQVVYEAEYKNDKLTGVSSHYQPLSGVLLKREYWSDHYISPYQPVPDSVFQYYASGKKQLIARYTNSQRNNSLIAEGNVQMWYESGKTSSTYSLLNGLKHGTETIYYPNGNKQKQINRVNGKVSGQVNVWYENGMPALILTIAADTLVPPVVAFDKNGKPVKAGTTAFRESAAALIPDELFTNTAAPENPWSSPDTAEDFLPVETIDLPANTIMLYDDISIDNIYPGGNTAFDEFMKDQTVYPGADRYLGHETTLIIFLSLAPDGSISNTYIEKDSAQYITLQTEALRLIYCAPWQNPVRQPVSLYIPVRFAIKE